jgi:hypothetical protein
MCSEIVGHRVSTPSLIQRVMIVWGSAFVCNGELSMISEDKDFNQIAVPYLYLCIYYGCTA